MVTEEYPSNFLYGVRRDHVDVFNEISVAFQKQHLWLNSGGAATVALFFSEHESISYNIKLSCIFFIIGTLFSALSYLWEFVVFYSVVYRFDKDFCPLYNDSEDQLKEKKDKYMQYQDRALGFHQQSMYRAILGFISYFLFFGGVILLSLNII